MPKEVVLTPNGKTTRAAYILRNSDGTPVQTRTVDLFNAKHQKQIAEECGVDVAVVIKWTHDVLGGAVREQKRYALADEAAPSLHPTHTLYVRGLKQKRHEGRSIPTHDLPAAFMAHLPGSSHDEILEWEDVNELALLDVDFHTAGRKPSLEWVETTAMTKLSPVPMLWHTSKNGGLHAYYRRSGSFTANEQASLGALIWKTHDPIGTVEVKKVTRGLGSALIHTPAGDPDIQRAAKLWLAQGASEIADSQVQDWLESEGFEVGKRYGHERCPINPTPHEPSHGEPVVVTEAGIHCFRCASQMLGGGRRPGFILWSSLIGGRDAGFLRLIVEKLTHWGHARWVIQAVTGLEGELAKACYSAALKAIHAGTPQEFLIPKVFDFNTDKLTRMEGRWATVDEGIGFTKGMVHTLGSTPAGCRVDDEGKVTIDRAAVENLDTPHDQTHRGYPAVQVIRGVRLFKAYTDPSRLVVSAPPSWLRPFGATFYPKYVDPDRRMPVAEAKALIEEVVPRVNWKYLYGLILARACNEAHVGLNQHLLVTGVSKAGKTAHVGLAAGLLGDVVTPVTFVQDQDRFRSSVREASERGTFLSFDEFIKLTKQANPRAKDVNVLDPLLNFDEDSLSHKMYFGPIKLGRVGVCIWTETSIPVELQEQTQIARRVHYIKLVQKVYDWDITFAANNIVNPWEIRVISQIHANACNAIVSEIVDEYLDAPRPFQMLAERIGLTTLERSPEFTDSNEKFLDLFRQIALEPDPTPSMQRRFPGRGYKVISRGDPDHPLTEAWTAVADGGGIDWLSARRVLEKDWSGLLGVPDPVHCDIQNNGEQVAVRFRVGDIREPDKVNGEITTVPPEGE
jgi:hypothetical protein